MQEERIYRLLFENAVQGMVLRRGENIILVNQSFADMVGYTIDELLAFSFEDALNLIHPQDREVVLARFRDRVAGKDVPTDHEYRFIRRNGETGWWSATVSTIDYGGHPSILETYIDITERQMAEETVQRGRSLLAVTLDVLPVGVCLTDEAGYYRMMNDAYCAIYEYDRQEMLGQHYSVIMPPDQVVLANAHYARLLSGDMGIPVERKRQRKDGSIIYIEAANALVEGVDGQKMVITTVRDITERKQARAEIERLAHNLSERVKELNCLYGIAQLVEDPDTSLESIAEGTVRLIPSAFLYPEITCARIRMEDSTFATANCAETAWRLSTHIVAFGKIAGTLDVYLLEARPDVDEGPFMAEERALIGAVAERLGRIVERVRTDAALKQLNAELQARNEDLNAFAHTVAHDLKNPITVTVGFAEMLRAEYTTLPEDERNAYLAQIVRYGQKMQSIVDALLMLSSVRDIDAVEIVPLDMDLILVEVQERLQEMVTEYEGEIILPETWPVALGYTSWVEEVWVNYISNALKYGGRPPRCELGADDPSAGQVRFWVKDNGQGLSPAEQMRVFQPFERLGQQRMEGHGLGLSIVRRMIEKLGGQVGVESEIGKGSTFYFTLPT
jgi:PAS domain S-box-containing protein